MQFIDIQEFSPEVCAKLQYYVYALISPLDEIIFYIGKGLGNRIFQHELEMERDSEKKRIIQSIQAAGKSVKKYIITYGLTEKEAFYVENALISFCGLMNKKQLKLDVLANLMSGHRSDNQKMEMLSCGTTDEIQALLAPQSLPLSALGQAKIMFVKVKPTSDVRDLHRDLNQEKLLNPYDENLRLRTVSWWKMSQKKADSVEYIVGVYPKSGLIVSAYQVLDNPERYQVKDRRYNFEFNTKFIDEINGQKLFESRIKVIGTKFVDENGKMTATQNPIAYNF